MTGPRTVREYCLDLLAAESVGGKLVPPDGLLDIAPGPAIRVDSPSRPPGLTIVAGRQARTPSILGMADPAQRRRILHAFASHELQAIEIFAWALLAFPDAPRSFREGCVGIIREEQAHLRLYMDRIEALGGHFGDEPVSGHFWRRVPSIRTPLEFVCTMGLTFENANLDFASEHAAAARLAGDEPTAAALDRVRRDEIRHVRFAWEHLLLWKEPEQTPWEAYRSNVSPPLGASRARGATFDADCRRAAGFDDEFVTRLASTAPERPGGATR
ncbi:MAG: ferritin-like domain-containing protein [Planctomycetes bacterium]|nr:ferritin-like domain-containing protein [Planctomycetota bacterium]